MVSVDLFCFIGIVGNTLWSSNVRLKEIDSRLVLQHEELRYDVDIQGPVSYGYAG